MTILIQLPKLLCNQFQRPQQYSSRKLFQFVAIAFNTVDNARLQLVGPNRLCAEWILKNSGAVSLTSFPGKYLRDYNTLPPENIKIFVKEIDATDSSIMAIGFKHLENCTHIDKIILHGCKHLEDEGLHQLSAVKNSLEFLQISECANLTSTSLLSLMELVNLKELKIFNLPAVKNIDNILSQLRSKLSSCKILTQ